ncbi:hypothetical protein BGZ58_009587 [Dissophora ornata]|nr:hypothetical protein BGZ58_009587 [Dissophora ornata]
MICGDEDSITTPVPDRTTCNEDYLCAADMVDRRDCGYLGITEDDCNGRKCCWDTTPNNLNVPFCFFRQYECKGYNVQEVQETAHGLTIDLELVGGPTGCVRFGDDTTQLTVLVDFETESRIRVKIVDKNTNRYEIPTEALPSTESTIRRTSLRDYSFNYTQNPFTFSITRVEDGEVIFDSSVAGVDSLVYENEYLEISTTLPNDANIYGLGEVATGFRRDSRGTRQALWARDAPTPIDENLYGSHPFHLEMRDGSAHGVFLRNSNGMDVIITPNKITYKVIGGVLDFTVFVGPSPVDVINQYTEVIGRPLMPPAWSMGFHHSRYGYGNIDQVNEVVRRYKQADLPLDGVWIDIDYMDSFKDFSFDETRFPKAKVRALAENLESNYQNMILIVDPGIPIAPGYEPYDTGMQGDVFIKDLMGQPVEGRVWPGQTYFPDFFNTNETWAFWQHELGKTRDDLGDNVYPWIDMNEPSNFCNGACSKDSPEDDPRTVNLKYAINNGGRQAPLDEKTLAEDAVHKNGLRLTDTHNLYGHMEAQATHHSLLELKPETRPFVLTRSSFAGTGAYAAHWTGDNWSQWNHLYLSIPGILSFGLFGIPFTGADICGFNGDATEELCLRWHQLGSLYPFSRNHNDIHSTDQEPYIWPNTVLPATRQALQIRYSLLPYYYTLFNRAHQTGQPIWQPLFFRYPQDALTLKIDKQFMLGNGIMISPALYRGQIQVKAYFPGDGRWFDFTTHQCVMETDPNSNTNTDPNDDRPNRYEFLKAKMNSDPIPMSIAGGQVIPIQNPMLTVAETRLQPISLIIALDHEGNAQGEMFVDDGTSVQNLYQARVSWEMTAGQQLISHAALQWPSSSLGGGSSGGGGLTGMSAAQAQEFRTQLRHGDKIEKIVVMGLNFGRYGGEKNIDGPIPSSSSRHWGIHVQGRNSNMRRRNVSGRGHSGQEAKDQTPVRVSLRDSRVTPDEVPVVEPIFQTSKMSSLSELNINGAQVPLGDALHGGNALNRTAGQDPATGFAWSVDQNVGSLTLTGLDMDLFNGWFVHWKTE